MRIGLRSYFIHTDETVLWQTIFWFFRMAIELVYTPICALVQPHSFLSRGSHRKLDDRADPVLAPGRYAVLRALRPVSGPKFMEAI
jgi:hypothetical protein